MDTSLVRSERQAQALVSPKTPVLRFSRSSPVPKTGPAAWTVPWGDRRPDGASPRSESPAAGRRRGAWTGERANGSEASEEANRFGKREGNMMEIDGKQWKDRKPIKSMRNDKAIHQEKREMWNEHE